MLVLLRSKNILKFWDILAPAIEQSFLVNKKADYKKLNAVLRGLLNGSLACWLKVEKEKPIYFILATTLNNINTSIGMIIIYTFHIFNQLNTRQINEITDDISEIAIQANCFKVLAFIENEILKKALEKGKWKIDINMLIMEV